jgi:hypothetical protein
LSSRGIGFLLQLRDKILSEKPVIAAKVPRIRSVEVIGSLPAGGHKPQQNDRDGDERGGNRADDLELQQLGVDHGETRAAAATSIVPNNAAGSSDVPIERRRDRRGLASAEQAGLGGRW